VPHTQEWRTHWGWHPETFVCSRRGHITPAAHVARLRPEDAGLGVDLPGGRRLVRCTRCDVWVDGHPPAEPSREVLPPLSEVPVPRRGRPLRDAIVLRLIAIDRGVHTVIFAALAALVILVDLNFASLRSEVESLLQNVTGQTGQGASQGVIVREFEKFLNVHKGTLTVLFVTAVAYAVVEGVEAVGLWLERRWAEYLTAIATAGFLPFEIHELTVRVTVLRIAALVVNVAILVYLVWRKRLFGIRGGVKALERGRELDREELFGPPATASQA
jgi:uncharacterized membrane protein (DUF2068 family)